MLCSNLTENEGRTWPLLMSIEKFVIYLKGSELLIIFLFFLVLKESFQLGSKTVFLSEMALSSKSERRSIVLINLLDLLSLKPIYKTLKWSLLLTSVASRKQEQELSLRKKKRWLSVRRKIMEKKRVEEEK